MLAFSAIRNNDKVGLILFTDEVEKYIPPRKGRFHVLRVIREIMFHQPARRGTDINCALKFLSRVTTHKAIAVVISDFIGQTAPTRREISAHLLREVVLSDVLKYASVTSLRQANRRHDVVAVQVMDRFEMHLPAIGRVLLKDAETGEVMEVDTGDPRKRAAFASKQKKAQHELGRLFRSVGIDSIQLTTDENYEIALARFFETREKRRLRG